jgi:hypothetical protein
LCRRGDRDVVWGWAGDTGAVGRIHVAGKQGLLFDIKGEAGRGELWEQHFLCMRRSDFLVVLGADGPAPGHQYRGQVYRCRTFLLVNMGDEEAKVIEQRMQAAISVVSG